MDRKIKLLHVGSFVTLKALQHYLNEAEIENMIKDIINSGRLAGFGTSNSSDELYVFEKDFEQAKKVLDSFLKVE